MFNSKRLRWAGDVDRMDEGRSAFKILTGKPKEKRSFGRLRRTWEDIIRIDLKELGINSRKRVESTRNRYYWRALVNAA